MLLTSCPLPKNGNLTYCGIGKGFTDLLNKAEEGTMEKIRFFSYCVQQYPSRKDF